MVSANEASVDLREICPLSRNILHSGEVRSITLRDSERIEKYIFLTSVAEAGQNSIPALRYQQETCSTLLTFGIPRRAEWVSLDNRHLRYLAESISVNVGGSQQNVKASSLPMSVESVGAVIVVRGWESQPHGEGPQFVGTSKADGSRIITWRIVP